VGRGQPKAHRNKQTLRPRATTGPARTGLLLDMRDQPCRTCIGGQYIERDGFDDMAGWLHCSACGASIERWQT
jgi:hypothetical protein